MLVNLPNDMPCVSLDVAAGLILHPQPRPQMCLTWNVPFVWHFHTVKYTINYTWPLHKVQCFHTISDYNGNDSYMAILSRRHLMHQFARTLSNVDPLPASLS